MTTNQRRVGGQRTEASNSNNKESLGSEQQKIAIVGGGQLGGFYCVVAT